MSVSCATFDVVVNFLMAADVGGPASGSIRAADGSTSTWREILRFLCIWFHRIVKGNLLAATALLRFAL